MSTDAMRAALEALLDAHARNTLFSGAGHWEQARAALAQPTSAERVPLTDEQIDAVPLIGVALPERFHETRALNAALRQFARAIERAHGITGETE